MLSSTYRPVEHEFYELIDELRNKGDEIKVFFFTDQLELKSLMGRIDLIVRDRQGERLKLSSGEPMRLDRIVSLNGIPGPLYEYYESFGHACIECKPEPEL